MNHKMIGKVESVRKLWLEKKEAKAYLGNCSDEYLDNLAKEEMITASKVGKKFFYQLDSIDNLIKMNVFAVQRIQNAQS